MNIKRKTKKLNDFFKGHTLKVKPKSNAFFMYIKDKGPLSKIKIK